MGAFGTDALNPGGAGGGLGGAALGKETATLALNVAFNNANVLGSAVPGFTYLVYPSPGDALDGYTVTQIVVRLARFTASAASAGG